MLALEHLLDYMASVNGQHQWIRLPTLACSAHAESLTAPCTFSCFAHI